MSTFQNKAGQGALFGTPNEDGEIVISGEWATPETTDVVIRFTGSFIEDGSISLVGECPDRPQLSATCLLQSREDDDEGIYKFGTIVINGGARTREYAVSSKAKLDRHGHPYRLLWPSSTRVAI